MARVHCRPQLSVNTGSLGFVQIDVIDEILPKENRPEQEETSFSRHDINGHNTVEAA